MMGLKEKDNQMDKTTKTNKNSRKPHNSKVRPCVNCLWIINKYCVKKEIKLMIQCMMLVFKLRTSWSSNKYCVKKEIKLMTQCMIHVFNLRTSWSSWERGKLEEPKTEKILLVIITQ